MTKSIAQQNAEFEADVKDLCSKHLKPGIDADHYVYVSLNELFWGDDQPYMHENGNEYSFEIPAHDSVDGIPHSV